MRGETIKGNQEFGHWGEKVAMRFLEKKDYIILDNNVRTPYGEIDIIAKKNNRLFFVEVKTRSSMKFGNPEEAITETKIVHMIESAQSFHQEHPDLEIDWQIDVIAVQKQSNGRLPIITHFPNAIS
jgi:putative endonuclease